MIRVHRLANVFEPRRRDVVEVAAGPTFRELARDLRLPEHEEGVRILHEGKRLDVSRLDEAPNDGDELVLVEDVQADVALSIAASIAVNLALSYATQKLFPVRKAQARGDISSPSGAWDQVQTTYGPGQVIPLNYGEPEVGGHVIYADISPKAIPGEQISTQETLNVILLVGDGRHDAIGGVQGDYGGEANNLGANNDFPANVRINGSLVPSNPSTTRAWIRLGRVDQTPLPDFPDSRAVIGVNAALAEGQEVIATIPDTGSLQAVSVILRFPAGLYRRNTSSVGVEQAEARVDLYGRKQGQSGWGLFHANLQIRAAVTQPVSWKSPLCDFGGLFGPTGPFELRVVRRVVAQGSGVVADCTVSQALQITWGQIAYARCAILALRIDAGDSWAGGLPDFKIRPRGLRVRTITDAFALSTAYAWGVTSPWSYPVGKNPAFVLLDYLLNPLGLGPYMRVQDIDLVAIRQWADYCDQDVPAPGGGSEARHQIDISLDSEQGAWDPVRIICAVGRAVPVMVGSKLSVVYDYRDAHGRGTVSVPAKAVEQVFGTANVTDFQIHYRDTEDRDTVLQAQILNAANGYERDVITVPDPHATGITDPGKLNALGIRRRTIRLDGVTRASEARRHLQYLHNLARLVDADCTFSCGPDALAATVGSVIRVVMDVFRPFDTSHLDRNCRIVGVSGSSYAFSESVTLEAGRSYIMYVQRRDGAITTANPVTPGTTTVYPAGTLVPTNTAAAADVGDLVALGVVGKVGRLFKIARLTLTGEMLRTIHATAWSEALYDLPDEEDWSQADDPPDYSFALRAAPVVDPATVALEASSVPGRAILSWSPVDARTTGRYRVLLRAQGQQEWRHAAEVLGTSAELDAVGLAANTEVLVLPANAHGEFGQADTGTPVAVVRPEFTPQPPPDLTRVGWAIEDDALRIDATALDSADVEFFEVRAGPYWLGAEVLARSRIPVFHVERFPSSNGNRTLHVRARNRAGLYSERWAVLSVSFTAPVGLAVTQEIDDLVSGAAGTATSCAWNAAGYLEMGADAMRAQYETAALDLGSLLTAWFALKLDQWWVESTLPPAWTWRPGSGEGFWRLPGGREPSPGIPGVDFELDPPDLVEAPPAYRDWSGGSPPGTIGHHARAVAEVSFDTTGSEDWTPYQRWSAGRFTARQVKLRVRMDRRSTVYALRASGLYLAVGT